MVPWSSEPGSWQRGALHPEVAATPRVLLLRLPLPQVLRLDESCNGHSGGSGGSRHCGSLAQSGLNWPE